VSNEAAVQWLAERIDGVDAAYRRDIALTTSQICREVGAARRCLEVMSLAGLALRLRSRARTDDRPDVVWRQGVRLGALLLLSTLAIQTAAGNIGVIRLLGAIGLLAAVGCSLAGLRMTAVGLAAAAATLALIWVVPDADAGAFASCFAVGIVGLITGGSATSAHQLRRTALAVAALALLCALSATLNSLTATEALSTVALDWAIPIVLVCLGFLDPRLSAAATALVFTRLAASGFGELGRALAVLSASGHRDLLARWMLMGVGVVATWLATDRSIRRVARL
jgi:hypothetical protein